MIEAEGLENVERFEDVERLEEVQRLEDAEIVNIVDIVDSVQRVEHNGQGVGWWTGKVLLHMAYMIVLLGCFGGIFTEIILSRGDIHIYLFYKESLGCIGVVFLVLSAFFIVVPTCFVCVAYKWNFTCKTFSVIFYIFLTVKLLIDAFLSFYPPAHGFGLLNPDWPVVREITKSVMKMDIFQEKCMFSIKESLDCKSVDDCLWRYMPYVIFWLRMVRIVSFFSITLAIAGFEAISKGKCQPRIGRTRRIVKLGRTYTQMPMYQHWAVQVIGEGNSPVLDHDQDQMEAQVQDQAQLLASLNETTHWFEVAGGMCFSWFVSRGDGINRVLIGDPGDPISKCGAGWLGGEIVGWTDKTDDEITQWKDEWLQKCPRYNVEGENCQKFAYELIVELTDGVFTVPHRFDASRAISAKGSFGGFSLSLDGSTIKRYGSGDQRVSWAWFGFRYRWTEFQVQTILSRCKPGFGLFLDASVARVEASFGNIVGLHVDYNLNTGIGTRNGNIEAHLLGLGARAGADGLDVNTPIGGVNCCNIM